MIAKVYTRTAIVVFTTGLLVIALEVAAGRILARTSDHLVSQSEHSPYYATRPWAKPYHEEFTRLTRSMRYHPYTIWRFPPFQGRYINTDEEGLRVTPGVCGRVRVWLFGGSTLWGFGAPDDGTIAAHVQRLMPGACIKNYGQLGYTSTQGVITLESELRQGRRPDLVIFYDGVNDTMAAMVYQKPGLHPFVAEVAEKLEHPFSLKNWMTWSNQFQLLKRVVGKPGLLPAQPDVVADIAVAAWVENHRIVQALAKAYQFEYAFFWQPTIFAGRARTEPVPADPEMASLFQRTHARVSTLRRDVVGLHDLTGALDDFQGHADLDWHHLSGEANEVVAEAMLRTVRNLDVRSAK